MRDSGLREIPSPRGNGKVPDVSAAERSGARTSRGSWVLAQAIVFVSLIAVAHAQSPRIATHEAGEQVARKAAVETFLRHIYSIYFGVRACTEMSARENDGSFRPDVTLEEARRTLRSIDAATSEVGIDSNAIWSAAAPLATVTVEALKRDPAQNLVRCQTVGALFRTDAANLQANLAALGAKTTLIPKDY